MSMELVIKTDLQKDIPKSIEFNFETLKGELQERLAYYNNLTVSEDSIKEAKADRAKLNKLRTAIDTRRKDIKKEFLKPYNDFEGKIKELTVLIDEPIHAIDTQLDTYEEKRKEAKMAKIKEAYEEYIDPIIEGIIPLERIMDQKWLNSTTSMKKVQEDLEAWNDRVNADLLAMDTVEPEYQASVKEKYIATLSVAQALAHRDQLKAAQEAFRAREAEKKAKEEQQAIEDAKRAAEVKSEPQPEPEPQPEAMEIPEERIYSLKLEFRVTREQARALREFIDQNHILYRKF